MTSPTLKTIYRSLAEQVKEDLSDRPLEEKVNEVMADWFLGGSQSDCEFIIENDDKSGVEPFLPPAADFDWDDENNDGPVWRLAFGLMKRGIWQALM